MWEKLQITFEARKKKKNVSDKVNSLTISVVILLSLNYF